VYLFQKEIAMKRIRAGVGRLLLLAMLFYGLNAAAQGWPQFRGPSGEGQVDAKNSRLPLSWSETGNVVWKTEIPNIGWSTPVVSAGQVWLSSATEGGHDFFAYCVDAETGKLLFEKHLFHCDAPEPLGNSVNCYASPSAALEKGRVYIHFGSYGTACLDTASGETIWKRDDMPCRHYRGPGSSAIIFDDLLILTFDGVDQQYVTALDKRTGKTVWKTERNIAWDDIDDNGKPKREGDFRKAFTTPIVIEVGGKEQLISPASAAVFAYEPRTGKEIWKAGHGGHSASVSPVFGKGLVLATTGLRGNTMMAIRPDGAGDVTQSHMVWRFEDKDVPTTPSPVVVGDLLFMLGNRGAVTCLDIGTGEEVWRERLGGNYIASMLCAGDRIYCFSITGNATVIRAGRTFEKLAESELDSGFMASPVVVGNALILRTKTHLPH
jgi:outer membrane protein assembly factor BamB